MKSQRLFVIGIGPGDPKLITLKAKEILDDINCILVPKGRDEGISIALNIASAVVDLTHKEIVEVHFPMIKKGYSKDEHTNILDERLGEAISLIVDAINKWSDVAFVTLGDPSIYSTFFNVYKGLMQRLPHLELTIIPGISSFSASSASASLPLVMGDEKLALIPATYEDEKISTILDTFETVVFMKVHRVFDKIVNLINKKGLFDKSIYVSQVGMINQRIIKDLKDVTTRDLNYFSLLIVKKGGW